MQPAYKFPTNGLILYQGPSELDPTVEIVVIVTGLRTSTANQKTGDLLQAWILVVDEKPGDNQRSGADAAICGTCPARPFNKGVELTDPETGEITIGTGDCYVTMQGVTSVWKAFKAGNYPHATTADFKAISRRALRIGSYGDPAAVPFTVWSQALFGRDVVGMSDLGAAVRWRRAERLAWTGYSHQRLNGADPRLRLIVMASADTAGTAERHRAAGWRTFRVVRGDEPGRMAGEFRCPSDPSWDREHVPCATCGLCNGDSKARSPFIVTHGFRAQKDRKAVSARLAVL